MTRDQLFEKWTARGTFAAGHDDWMTPCYDDNLAHGVDIDELLPYSREQWEATDHFYVRYGSIMYYDALDFFIALGELGKYPDVEDVISLKMDLVEVFWDAWEDEIGAAETIARLREDRPQRLAEKMLDLLYCGGGRVVFTNGAIENQTPEYQALMQWLHHRHGSMDFLFDQIYYMLDYVAANGLEDIDDNFPEADVYTLALAHWLAGSVWNLNYVTDVLNSGVPATNGTDLLQRAQYQAIADIWRSLVEMMEEHLA